MSNSNQMEQKIMADITSGRIKLRSKYVFFAEKLGLGSAFALSILLAILFFNLVLFYLKTSDNLAYLSFGNSGLFAFLESFPYLLVIVLIVLIFLAGLIVKTTDIAYKKPFGYLAVILVIFVMVSGIVLTYTGVAEQIELETYNTHFTGKFFRPFLRYGLGERQRGLMGQITEVQDDYLLVQTPYSLKKLDISNLEIPFTEDLHPGLFIMAIGENTDGIFEAQRIRLVNEQDIQMIRRGVRHRFDNFDRR